MRALERRIAAGLKPDVTSVASLFVSRWDKAIAEKVPETLRNTLGIAVAQQTYKAYWDLLNSQRWRALESQGACPQRLLWASTGTKDPKAPAALYVEALAAPNTINTMPEKTLLAFVETGMPSAGLSSNAIDPDPVLAKFEEAKIDVSALAKQLQDEGGKSFVRSWNALMDSLARKRTQLAA